MSVTVAQILNELEKPENEGQIKHLVHLKNLSNLDDLRQIKGIGGLFSKFILTVTSKHMDALIALSECKTTADITEFKQSKHYKKVKSTVVEGDVNLEDLAELKELQNLKDRF